MDDDVDGEEAMNVSMMMVKEGCMMMVTVKAQSLMIMMVKA